MLMPGGGYLNKVYFCLGCDSMYFSPCSCRC